MLKHLFRDPKYKDKTYANMKNFQNIYEKLVPHCHIKIHNGGKTEEN